MENLGKFLYSDNYKEHLGIILFETKDYYMVLDINEFPRGYYCWYKTTWGMDYIIKSAYE